MTSHGAAHADPDASEWAAPDPLDVRLETPRLLIRSYAMTDVPAVFEAVNESREQLLPYMPWAQTDHRELASTARYVSTQVLARHGAAAIDTLGVGIFEHAGGVFLGGTGFHDLRRDTVSAETGYWIRTSHQRRGYCTEAMRHFLSWLLRPQDQDGLGLRRARLYCSSANLASRRVLEKLGVPLEAQQRGEDFVRGVGITDRLGWGVLAEEWNGRQATREFERTPHGQWPVSSLLPDP